MAHVHDYLEPGTELAGYRIQSLIARGGMGVVYRALDVQLGRPVALKLLAPELSANDKFRQRFIRESKLAASVDHPNILPVYGAGEWQGLLYIAMRYVRGTDVKAELDARGPLPLPEAMRILSDTSAALDAAHAAGLVHRDVKPGNILLSDDRADGRRHVYLTDFGLTKRATSATGVTTAGHFLGTLDYVAPEQIRGEDVDGRADVYALACVAYTLLAGHPPFDHADDSAQLWAHMVEDPPHLSRERPDVPPFVESAILAGMAKDRDNRPLSCGMLVDMMSDVGSPAGHGDEASAVTRPAGAARNPSGGDAVTAGGSPARSNRAAVSAPRIARHAGARRRPGTGGQRRALRLAGLGVLLVLLLTAGLLLPGMLSGEGSVTFRAEGIPYTLEVPRGWTEHTRRAGDSTVSVLSPTDLSALFAGEPDAPADAAARSASDPSGVVGLAIYHRPAGLKDYSPAARVATAEALLPGRDAHLVDRGEVTIGEVQGQSMEGTMPLSPSATLRVRVLVVETEPVQLMVFFAPSALFDERTDTFDEIARSLRRTE